MGRLRALAIVALALTGVLAAAVSAQQKAPPAPAATTPSQPSMSDLLERIGQEQGSRPGATDTFRPTSECGSFSDETTRERCWTAYREYFGYYESGFAHRKAVFWWQLVSSRVIFVVVLGLVGVGVFFAWVQFRRDLVARAVSEPSPVSQLEIGQAGVKVSSPVLGVIILTLSLAFFYLYLVYVYPITEIL